MNNTNLLNVRTVLAAVVMGAGVARGTLYTETFSSVNAAIPQGNPVGVAITETVSGIPSGMTVGALTVGLDISGGYNGSLYAYLVAPNGTLVMLLNQPGVSGSNPFGASGSGMNITLQNGSSTHGLIQNETSSSVLSGSYNAAGSLSGFYGSAANGTWTLFFADLASGGGQATLSDWSLGITAAPEPVNVAMAFFGVGIVGIGAARAYRLSRKQTPPSV